MRGVKLGVEPEALKFLAANLTRHAASLKLDIARLKSVVRTPGLSRSRNNSWLVQ